MQKIVTRIIFILLFACSFILISCEHTPTNQPVDKEQKADKEKQVDKEQAVYWGIDTASIITESFYNCVEKNYGAPAVVGRYLETKEDVSFGLTKDEVSFLHDKGVKLLLIYNHFTEAIGHKNGVAEAKTAISFAQELGVTNGVYLFADIEPTYPVDAEFIRGWVETLSPSPYQPGIYGIFEKDSKLSKAYLGAISINSNIKSKTAIWGSQNPLEGITRKEDAPAFKPKAPEFVEVLIWQYGIDGEDCNIDTNLIRSEIMEDLW
jgi:hypothetical protein